MTKSGGYTTKSGYDFFTRIPYPMEANIHWKSLWGLDIPQKQFFLWQLE
jgi:hypothetical protein